MTARDDARTHPTVDELADLREGLLSTADQARVRGHVDGCAECAAEVAAIDEVATVLRDAGVEPVTIPDSVARAIDDALQQAAATPSSQPVRARAASAPEPSRRRWVKPAFGWLAGAAAAVIVIGGIGVGLNNAGSSDDSASDSAGGAVATRDGALPEAAPTTGEAGSGLDPGKRGHGLKHLSETSLSSFARDISGRTAAPQNSYTVGSDTAADARCSTAGMGGLKEPVFWHGDKALLVVRREARVASVYSCDATLRLLYSAPY